MFFYSILPQKELFGCFRATSSKLPCTSLQSCPNLPPGAEEDCPDIPKMDGGRRTAGVRRLCQLWEHTCDSDSSIAPLLSVIFILLGCLLERGSKHILLLLGLVEDGSTIVMVC